MQELQDYLTNEYPLDIQDIDDIEKLLVSVTKVYSLEFNKTTAWPYQIRAEKLPDHPDAGPADSGKVPRDTKKPSQSTTAMILDALLRFGGYFETLRETRWEGIKRNVFAIEAAKKDFDTSLAEAVREAGNILSVNFKDSGFKASSSTYGDNDIFTLAWIAEVASADWNALYGSSADNDAQKVAAWKEIAEKVSQQVLEKAKLWIEGDGEIEGDGKNFKVLLNPNELTAKVSTDVQQVQIDVQPHAFIVLRLAQALHRLSQRNHVDSKEEERDAEEKKRDAEEKKQFNSYLQACYTYFERLLHEHLSFSSIPDSRFDPAELMFCLEGMLVCQRNRVDRTVFDRVLAVLSDAQKESAYWRPVKPFLTTQQGYALFPVSVEIANSLMRSCAIFDRDSLQDTYGSRCIGLLRRYWQWLRVRAVWIKHEDGEKVGWHSEHVNERGVIHLWETSQVMGFLLSFRNELHKHIARTTLVLSRFTQKAPKYTPWKEVLDSHEPVDPKTGIGDREKLSVYHSIRAEFIEPHRNQEKNPNFSMLLYGPPGTGKTTIANGLANELNRRFITITVSDFLSSGGAQLEARAKDIFTVLISQPECVVLFDEIDHFLLDRDSERYGKQDTLFQFMTPGMLTKLNDLRRQERCLFVVATNYEDRIDAAIKRTGRIDQRYLVLPPDAEKRKLFIQQWIGEVAMKDDRWQPRIFGKDFTVNEEQWKELKRESLFLGYSDIEGAVKEVRNRPEITVEALRNALTARARTTSLEAYQSRFSGEKGPLPVRETPIREFLCLLALYCEAHIGNLLPGKLKEEDIPKLSKTPIKDSVRTVLGKCYEVIQEELNGKANAADVIRNHAPELNERASFAVAEVLSNFKPEKQVAQHD